MNDGPLYPDNPTIWEANRYCCSLDGCDIYESSDSENDRWMLVVYGKGDADDSGYVTWDECLSSQRRWLHLPTSVQELAQALYQLHK